MTAEPQSAKTAGPAPAVFDPMSSAFRRDPYPAYARLRDEAPVDLSAPGFCTVARYDDVVHVLRNPSVFSSVTMGGPRLLDGKEVRTIISTDPPEHTAIRNLVNRAFTPRMVDALEPRIREITRELLDTALAGGSVDIIEALAVPLPVTVIAEILGIDPALRDDFKRWSSAVVANFDAAAGAEQQRLAADRREFQEYCRRAIDERRKQPKDDLISAIIRAEEDDIALTADELTGFAMLLLIAGNETTTNLIGNAILALTGHPDEMARVMAERALIPSMVEEALRYDSPVQFLFRVAKVDADLAGSTIKAGTVVVPIYASANRDDRRYPDAARFDVRRNAQGHVAFGLGPHFCLGAPLARMEARIAFEELFSRVRAMEPAGQPERADHMFLRGLRSFRVRLTSN